jgi:hypothetical protein
MTDCICKGKGNWRAIVAEVEPLLDTKFIDDDGYIWVLYGLVHGKDDYYYGMRRLDGKTTLLSCVGNLQAHGFEPHP